MARVKWSQEISFGANLAGILARSGASRIVTVVETGIELTAGYRCRSLSKMLRNHDTESNLCSNVGYCRHAIESERIRFERTEIIKAVSGDLNREATLNGVVAS
jgi:hypothetical protein